MISHTSTHNNIVSYGIGYISTTSNYWQHCSSNRTSNENSSAYALVPSDRVTYNAVVPLKFQNENAFFCYNFTNSALLPNYSLNVARKSGGNPTRINLKTILYAIESKGNCNIKVGLQQRLRRSSLRQMCALLEQYQ